MRDVGLLDRKDLAALLALSLVGQPMLEVDTETGRIERYQWRAIH